MRYLFRVFASISAIIVARFLLFLSIMASHPIHVTHPPKSTPANVLAKRPWPIMEATKNVHTT